MEVDVVVDSGKDKSVESGHNTQGEPGNPSRFRHEPRHRAGIGKSKSGSSMPLWIFGISK